MWQQKPCYTAFQAGNILHGHIGQFRYMFVCHVPVEAVLPDPQADLHIEQIFLSFLSHGVLYDNSKSIARSS